MQTKGISLALAILALSLGGCGFALRGSSYGVAEHYQPLYILANRESQVLSQALQRQLAINNVRTTPSRAKAKLIVAVELLRKERRSIALDREARDAEYALFERARLSLRSPDGKMLHGPVTLEQRRIIVNDPDNPVGEQTETDIVRAEMREQLGVRLAQQVEYWTRDNSEAR